MQDPSLTYQQLVSAAASRGDWYALGCFLVDLRKWGAASGCFARALAQAPEDHRAWTNWGWTAHLLGESGVAEERLRRAIDLAPNEGMPHALLCQVLASLGKEDEAVEIGRRGVELEPGPPVNHVGYSLALMTAGQWAEGWKEYEHRISYKLPEFLTRPYRLWRGEKVGHLYLEAEQGLGDTIFALRWLAEAAKRAERVTLYCQREVYSLIVEACAVPWNVTVLPMPRPLPEADAWSPLLSLPVAVEDGGPAWGGAYVSGTYADLCARYTLAERQIGIVWSGNPTHDQAHYRDCPLVYWLRLSEIQGVKLHSLQVGGQAQLGELAAYGLIEDRSPEISSMLDTAKIIGGLDLVITVDTSVAHLAGAMGMPTWLLVNQRGTDFRWGRRGDSTPWYPSIRIFRRETHEDWAAVMDRVGVALRGLVE